MWLPFTRPTFLQLAVVSGTTRQSWYTQLEAEHDNLRTALDWALRHDPGAAVGLLANLWQFWFWNGYWSEGTTWARRILDAPDSDQAAQPELVLTLLGGANLASRTGEYALYRAWLGEALALREHLGPNDAGLTWLYLTQSFTVVDYKQVVALLDKSIATAQLAGDDWLVAIALYVLGDRARTNHDFDRARECYQRSLVYFVRRTTR